MIIMILMIFSPLLIRHYYADYYAGFILPFAADMSFRLILFRHSHLPGFGLLL